jgi:hypothetical protein
VAFYYGVKEMIKKKFVLEFDEEPALVFVQRKFGTAVGDAEFYQDGKKVNGWRTLSIDAGIDDLTTHQVEFITGATKEK